eukprot:scaffold28368_cov63-Phaeocystis_antarctica.AAC.3
MLAPRRRIPRLQSEKIIVVMPTAYAKEAIGAERHARCGSIEGHWCRFETEPAFGLRARVRDRNDRQERRGRPQAAVCLLNVVSAKLRFPVKIAKNIRELGRNVSRQLRCAADQPLVHFQARIQAIALAIVAGAQGAFLRDTEAPNDTEAILEAGFNHAPGKRPLDPTGVGLFDGGTPDSRHLLSLGRVAPVSDEPFVQLRVPSRVAPLGILLHSLVVGGSLGVRVVFEHTTVPDLAAHPKTERTVYVELSVWEAACLYTASQQRDVDPRLFHIEYVPRHPTATLFG